MKREPDDSSQPLRPPAKGPDAAPTSAAIFFDLATRDGRRAVEVRSVTTIANGFYASPRATLYSCAYETQSERIAALRRARLFCEAGDLQVIHQGEANGRRSAWQ